MYYVNILFTDGSSTAFPLYPNAKWT